ncbi:hypothetical protein K1719_035204 [Acacia pycnantha]|nr:hypothetical protein K1719_035204 [Acacia pycnantha]
MADAPTISQPKFVRKASVTYPSPSTQMRTADKEDQNHQYKYLYSDSRLSQTAPLYCCSSTLFLPFSFTSLCISRFLASLPRPFFPIAATATSPSLFLSEKLTIMLCPCNALIAYCQEQNAS